jgi:2-hydroxy-4-carboxymuconate semialdehyde hemiacetal dehydrogenase
MRLTIVGYGTVAEIHARRLRRAGVQIDTVYGPSEAKARKFAEERGARRATTNLAESLSGADAAILCSPSQVHYEQALRAVECGVTTLVELPACGSLEESLRLQAAAEANRVRIECAHTARYLAPYRMIGSWIGSGRLGEIRSIHYARSVPHRERSWKDDALLHHAEHPVDLMLHWFSLLQPAGFAAAPSIPGAQDVSLLARLPHGAPVSVSISYSARLARVNMNVAGEDHTVVTDGFSFIESDDPELEWKGDAREIYEQAIEDQDIAFLAGRGVPWEETVRLNRSIGEFAALWNRG